MLYGRSAVQVRINDLLCQGKNTVYCMHFFVSEQRFNSPLRADQRPSFVLSFRQVPGLLSGGCLCRNGAPRPEPSIPGGKPHRRTGCKKLHEFGLSNVTRSSRYPRQCAREDLQRFFGPSSPSRGGQGPRPRHSRLMSYPKGCFPAMGLHIPGSSPKNETDGVRHRAVIDRNEPASAGQG